MKNYLVVVALVVAGLCMGCEKQEAQPIAEPQAPAVGDGWLMFSLRPADGPSSENVKRYQAAYVAEGKTARFDIELTMARPSGQLPVAFTKGKFIAVANSDAFSLLMALQKTLQAKAIPSNSLRVAELPFSAAILGEHVSHSPSGGFAVKPPGNGPPSNYFWAMAPRSLSQSEFGPGQRRICYQGPGLRRWSLEGTGQSSLNKRKRPRGSLSRSRLVIDLFPTSRDGN